MGKKLVCLVAALVLFGCAGERGGGRGHVADGGRAGDYCSAGGPMHADPAAAAMEPGTYRVTVRASGPACGPALIANGAQVVASRDSGGALRLALYAPSAPVPWGGMESRINPITLVMGVNHDLPGCSAGSFHMAGAVYETTGTGARAWMTTSLAGLDECTEPPWAGEPDCCTSYDLELERVGP